MKVAVIRMVQIAPPMMRTRPTGPRKNFVSAELPGMRSRIPRYLDFVGTKCYSLMPPGRERAYRLPAPG